MCFKNLPIEFDAHGQPRLRDDTPGFDMASRREHESLVEAITRSASVRDFNIDPVTRVAGRWPFTCKWTWPRGA